MAESPTNADIRAIMMEVAKVQVAALNAGIEFWRQWIESASHFAQTANVALATLGERDANVDETLSSMADSTRVYLQAITQLPDKAAAHFKSDLDALTTKKAEPTRSARAKE